MWYADYMAALDVKENQEGIEDRLAEKTIEVLSKAPPIQRIRSSHILSAILGAAGLGLFIVGVEKVFEPLHGFASIGIGIVVMALSGVLLQNVTK